MDTANAALLHIQEAQGLLLFSCGQPRVFCVSVYFSFNLLLKLGFRLKLCPDGVGIWQTILMQELQLLQDVNQLWLSGSFTLICLIAMSCSKVPLAYSTLASRVIRLQSNSCSRGLIPRRQYRVGIAVFRGSDCILLKIDVPWSECLAVDKFGSSTHTEHLATHRSSKGGQKPLG